MGSDQGTRTTNSASPRAADRIESLLSDPYAAAFLDNRRPTLSSSWSRWNGLGRNSHRSNDALCLSTNCSGKPDMNRNLTFDSKPRIRSMHSRPFIPGMARSLITNWIFFACWRKTSTPSVPSFAVSTRKLLFCKDWRTNSSNAAASSTMRMVANISFSRWDPEVDSPVLRVVASFSDGGNAIKTASSLPGCGVRQQVGDWVGYVSRYSTATVKTTSGAQEVSLKTHIGLDVVRRWAHHSTSGDSSACVRLANNKQATAVNPLPNVSLAAYRARV